MELDFEQLTDTAATTAEAGMHAAKAYLTGDPQSAMKAMEKGQEASGKIQDCAESMKNDCNDVKHKMHSENSTSSTPVPRPSH